jgi:hypothetical protein
MEIISLSFLAVWKLFVETQSKFEIIQRNSKSVSISLLTYTKLVPHPMACREPIKGKTETKHE